MAHNNSVGIRRDLASVEKELGHASAGLLSQFQSVLTPVSLRLSTEEVIVWAEEGVVLARSFPPASVEAAEAYFQATPAVLDNLTFPRFLGWVHGGEILCRYCPALAGAYFRASPGVLALLPGKLLEVWREIGKSLYHDTTESRVLASGFFTATPDLLRSMSLVKIERLAIFLNRLAGSSYHLAGECLSAASGVLASVGREEQGLYLALALTLVRQSPEGAARYFLQGAGALKGIGREQQSVFLSLADKLARDSARRALAFFFDGSRALGSLDTSLHSRLLNRGETLLTLSANAGIAFLKSCPVVLARFGISGLERWFKEGVGILERDLEAGWHYFSLESVAEGDMKRLRAKVELEKIHRVLQMYGQALAGSQVQIQSNEGLAERSRGWLPAGTTTTDGTTIFVPLSMDRYDSEEANFTWYKVAVTHQAGHIEFGSFEFSFEKAGGLFASRRRELPSPDGNCLTDMERFFSLFDDTKLITDIFTVAEDVRIDYLLKQVYPGIRHSYRSIQQESLSRRPSLSVLPLREAFIELLVRMSLDDGFRVLPLAIRAQFRAAAQILQILRSPSATVEDSAEAALRLYEIITAISNKQLSADDWDIGGLTGTDFDADNTSLAGEEGQGSVAEPGIVLSHQSSLEVDFRGSFNPEQVQLRLKLREDGRQSVLNPVPLSPEALKELEGREIELTGITRGRHASSGLYVADLPDVGKVEELFNPEQVKSRGNSLPAGYTGSLPEEGEAASFLYDEWDFQACCYLPGWCRVREKTLAEGTADFFQKTLVRYSSLAARVRKQFEMLAPARTRKLNRLDDGEELDLNAVIQSVVERKAGCAPGEKIYWKRRKIQRDVAVVFLLDMSSSTANVIRNTDDDESYFDWYFDTAEALARWQVQRASGVAEDPRRVIDVIKESVVLMINALEASGDGYGVYGFSGHGRENVELLVIKGLEEKFSGAVARRIDRVVPLRSTRMGPAIRHVSSRLEANEARTKVLFLVSDGYPQDRDYGRDSHDREYALHDTRMALIEAKRKKIAPFCLTIDIAGHDYLNEMSPDIGCEVLNDVESLPQRLPLLYKRLTS